MYTRWLLIASVAGERVHVDRAQRCYMPLSLSVGRRLPRLPPRGKQLLMAFGIGTPFTPVIPSSACPMSASLPGSPPYESRFTYPQNYAFPLHRLSRTLKDPSKTPIVLVACGSFSPVTYLHLRMFEMAKDYVRQNTDFEIMAGYLSPVSDQYKKPGLLSAHHR